MADSAVTDEDIYKKFVTSRKPKDAYAQEVGPGGAIQRRFEGFLGDNVAGPLGAAGYPQLGAAAAAIPASVSDLLIPQTGADVAGIVVPFGKAGKVAKAAEEGILKDTAAVRRKLAEEPSISQKISALTENFRDKLISDVNGHLGSDLETKGIDPFAWSDVKSGTSKKILEAHKGEPLKISTRSDLLAHDDYISNLDPKLHSVEYHLSPDVPLSDFNSMDKYKGSPSFGRQVKAIKKLKDAGINVRIVGSPEKPLDDLSAMRSLGFVPEGGGK